MQLVKGVEEFLLGFLFTGNKLHIIHNQHINIAVFVAKALLLKPNMLQKVIHKGLGGNVHNACFRVVVTNSVANGLHKVGFTKPHTTV